MTIKVAPQIMFEGRAEEAMNFYCTHIPNTTINTMDKYGNDAPNPGKIIRAEMSIANQTIYVIDSAINHDFSLTPAFSMFIDCETEDVLDNIVNKLSENGKVMMPKDNYGFSQQFAFIEDQFGVSWQINLP